MTRLDNSLLIDREEEEREEATVAIGEEDEHMMKMSWKSI